MGYSFRLAERVLLYAAYHRQDNTYHGLCYTSHGTLAGTRNLNAYRVARAKARRDVRLSKNTSWRNYISKLNSQASVKSVWNRIRKIKGKESTNSIHHLSVNDRDVTSHRDIANALADSCSHNSSSAFSTDAFSSIRKKAEMQTIKCSSDNAEVYNKQALLYGRVAGCSA